MSKHAKIFIRTFFDHLFYKDTYQHVLESTSSGRLDSASIENPESWYRRLNADSRVEAFTPHFGDFSDIFKWKTITPATLIGVILESD